MQWILPVDSATKELLKQMWLSTPCNGFIRANHVSPWTVRRAFNSMQWIHFGAGGGDGDRGDNLSTPCNGFAGCCSGVAGRRGLLSTPCNGFLLHHREDLGVRVHRFQLHAMDSRL